MTKNFLDPITAGEVLREDFMEPINISMNKYNKVSGIPGCTRLPALAQILTKW